MNPRNVINIEINFARDQMVSYEKGIEAIKQHQAVKNIDLKYLLSINELVDLLDLTRAAFERNILENEIINTGVRHIHVTGVNFPRTRIYIDAIDLIKFLIKYCDLTYWKKVERENEQLHLIALTKDLISEQDIEYLALTLIEGRLKSSKIIEREFNRTRRLVSRLNNIMESITFAFPESRRQLRRFVFSETDTRQIEDYFKHYKSHENSIKKIFKD